MKWLLGTYTMRFNRRHSLTGRLFAGRYKSLLIDETTPDYLRTVCDYVHLNPARARLLKKGERLEKYPWSSYASYLQNARRRPAWLRCDRLLGEHGVAKETRRRRSAGAGLLARKISSPACSIDWIKRRASTGCRIESSTGRRMEFEKFD